MTGETIKKVLADNKRQMKDIAELLGTSLSNLSAGLSKSDIKTGLLEKISEASGIPIYEFYGDSYGMPSDVPVLDTSDASVLAMLKMKDEQLTLAMQQTSTAQDQTTEALAQMRQIIERLPRQNPTPPIVTIETGTSQQGVHLKTGGLPTSSVRRTTSRRSIGGKGKLVTSKKD